MEKLTTPNYPIPTFDSGSVEHEIELAGRQEVFARARELGWTVDQSPPLWVWRQIAAEVFLRRSRLSSEPKSP